MDQLDKSYRTLNFASHIMEGLNRNEEFCDIKERCLTKPNDSATGGKLAQSESAAAPNIERLFRGIILWNVILHVSFLSRTSVPVSSWTIPVHSTHMRASRRTWIKIKCVSPLRSHVRALIHSAARQWWPTRMPRRLSGLLYKTLETLTMAPPAPSVPW